MYKFYICQNLHSLKSFDKCKYHHSQAMNLRRGWDLLFRMYGGIQPLDVALETLLSGFQ